MISEQPAAFANAHLAAAAALAKEKKITSPHSTRCGPIAKRFALTYVVCVEIAPDN
jgi:hypothetical protein